MDWARSRDRLSATGLYSGIRAELHGGAWFLVDWRATPGEGHPARIWARGPFSGDGAARAAAEAKFERGSKSNG